MLERKDRDELIMIIDSAEEGAKAGTTTKAELNGALASFVYDMETLARFIKKDPISVASTIEYQMQLLREKIVDDGFCPECGEELDEEDNHCHLCGVRYDR